MRNLITWPFLRCNFFILPFKICSIHLKKWKWFNFFQFHPRIMKLFLWQIYSIYFMIYFFWIVWSLQSIIVSFLAKFVLLFIQSCHDENIKFIWYYFSRWLVYLILNSIKCFPSQISCLCLFTLTSLYLEIHRV